jgi:hypothetical protein
MAYKVSFKRSQALLSGFLVMFLFFFSSCDKLLDLLEGGDDEEDEIIEIPYSPTSWEVGYEGETVSVEFTASDDWKIVVDESSESWISVSSTEGSAGDYTLDISVSVNETNEQRYGFVTIYSGDERVDIYITQYGFETVLDLFDSQTFWDISYEETVLNVNFFTNTDWSVEIDESASSWISVSPTEGAPGEYTLEIFVSENGTYEQRGGTVTIVSGNERRDINIMQNRFETVLDIPDYQTFWDISNSETLLKVNLFTNVDWSVEIDQAAASWISVTPSKGTAGEYTLEISVSANETEEARYGMLTIVSGDERRDIYINQKEKTFQPEGEGPEDMPIEEWK